MVRPRLWLSHMMTAAALYVFAIVIDAELRFDAGEARHVRHIESGLVVYGTICAIVSLARGALTKWDKAMLLVCFGVFLVTAFVALLTGRVIHN
jgi:uncharacterized membrane protein